MKTIQNSIFLGIFYLTILYSSNAYSAPKSNTVYDKQFQSILLAKVEKEKLYEDPTWLRLLHIRITPKVKKHSDIISPVFFNAYPKSKSKLATHRITSKQELLATLNAFYLPVKKDGNLHAQCRFPARFFWLNKKLHLKNKHLPKVECQRLEEWAKFNTLDSVSLIMVSGYFGNPASTFGHLIVKLNNSEHKMSSGNLLDQGINYGANVPQNEPIPIYITKGIFGGYVSKFSNKEYYTQDLIYSKHEFRDMWEYELNLNQEQKRLLVLHLWEMIGMESTYYFLKENCGYRIAELIELVTGHSLTPDRQPWYLPISVFQKLADVENSRYIKKITYIPSSQRKLYYGFNQLNKKEKKIVNKIIAKPSLLNSSNLLHDFPTYKKSKIIELMINFYQYKITSIENNQKKSEFEEHKNALLLARLKLPITKKNSHSKGIPIVTSPAKGSKPRLFQVGLAYDQAHREILELGLSAVHYDFLSNSKGSLENSELKVLELTLNYDTKQRLSLNKLALISIKKLALENIKLLGESNLSWQIATGFKKKNIACSHCTNFYAEGGVGRALKISNKLITYGMLNTGFHADDNSFHISPMLGIINTYNDRAKSVLEAGIITDIKTGKTNGKIKLEARYSFDKNNALRFSFEKDSEEEAKISFYRNW